MNRAPRFLNMLLYRGLLLVVLPMVCQIVFLVYLMTVITCDIKVNINRSSQSYNLIRKAYNYFRQTGSGVVITGLSNTLGQQPSPEVAKQRLQKLKLDAEELSTSIASDPNQRKNLEDLTASSKTYFAMLEETVPKGTSSEWHLETKRTLRRDIENYTPIYLEILTRIIDVEEKKNAADVEAVRKSIYRLSFVIALAAIAPIVLAVLLGIYYSNSISRPLSQLSSNGLLLSKRLKLPEVMDDAVEFRDVDKVLHLVSVEVEAALAREKEVVDNACDMICSLDRDDTFRATNSYSKRMLGYDAEELISLHLSDIALNEGFISAIESMHTTMHAGTVAMFELTMRRKDGGLVETKWSTVWSPSHQLFFCIVNDVTDLRRAEQLKHDFSDAISNDLSSPLVAIQTSLHNLLEGSCGEISRDVSTILTKTSKNVDRLVLLANELLDFQKIKGGKMQISPKLCSLSQIVEEAVDCVSTLAEPTQINLQLPKKNFSIECDRLKILQTIVNLLSNAIKFSPAKSTVEIAIEGDDQWVELSVIDAGPGIPADYQQRIFEPFEQVPSSQAKIGTGLGLAICKLIAEAHGGSISVASVSSGQSDSGSTFTIRLPARQH